MYVGILMATEEGMSGIDVRVTVAEINALLPLWVGKVYQPGPKTLLIRLNGLQHDRHHLLIEAGRRVHCTTHPVASPAMPPSFAMLLRKYLSGGKVLGVIQPGLERVMVIEVGKKDAVLSLVVEMYDEGNVILIGGDGAIIKPLWHHRFKDRVVVPGVRYEVPAGGIISLPEEDFITWLAGEEREVVKSLAIGCMLGGMYAEHVCRMAGVDKLAPARDADGSAIYTALRTLLGQVTEPHPVVSGRQCLPFSLHSGGEDQTYPTFSAALDAFYGPLVTGEERSGAKASRPQVSPADRIRRQQEEAIAKFEKKIANAEKAVEAVYTHYPLVAGLVTTLQEASSRFSWQEIAAKLKEDKTGAAGRIVAVDPAEAAVDLDFGVRVKVYAHEGVEASVARYYDQIKKMKKKIEGARSAMAKTMTPRPVQKSRQPVAKRRWFHRFRWSYTSDGVLLIGGRDAGQNEELVKKYMEGGDTFVHADVHGASVVIVKGTTARMDEAAQFAASYSGAWRSGHFTADVYAVLPGQVSKTPEAGEYVARGAFIIRGERTYFRDTPLGVAIGLLREPALAVVGGPPSSVAGQTSLYVDVLPGQYSENDTAKKVLKILRERLPPGQERLIRSVLNTEAVAAFIPAGGSDVKGAE
jgi:predicted ribosome quality control (RQC) complex YloA/Tae2 family protein